MANSFLTSDVVDKLLDKLGSDDAYRAKFQKDPHGALQDIGVNVDKSAVAPVSNLPDKDTIKKSRAAIKQAMVGQLGMWAFVK
jgi:putative modified peptide